MKKLSFLLVIALIATMLAIPAVADEMTYSQAPMLDELVANGELPPVEDRLPSEPLVVEPGVVSYAEYFKDYQIGKYGGTLKSVRNSATWDGWVWCLLNEYPIETVSGEGKDFYGNVFKDWDINEDFTEYTFYMREGMKWSDGEDLTTEDVDWKFNMGHANAELTSTWPNLLRTGNVASGNPCTMEVIDDYTFKVTFDGSYPGFIMQLAANKATTDYFIAPAHYLKDFHIDTADKDELTAKCEAAGYSLAEWFNLYGLYDYSVWDTAAENQIGSPSISAWIITQMEGTTAVYERNPYYWKVDAIGQQLPYVDKLTSTYCVDKEAIAVKILGGEVDYTYEWTPLNEIGLFAAGAEEGNYTLLTKTLLHRTGGDLLLNWTYDDPNWREVVNMYDFRAALALALDKEEIIDSVYFGFAEVADDLTLPEYDPQKAGELLDGIGMTMGNDGYRTYPNGDPCVIELIYSAWMTTYEPTAVLVTEYLRAIGLNIQMKFMDNDLLQTTCQANEMQMAIYFSHGPMYWQNITDYRPTFVSVNYYNYWNTRGEAGEEPNQIWDDWYNKYLFACTNVPAEEVASAHQAQRDYFKENLLYIMPIKNITQPSAISNRLRNFPSEGGFNLDNCRGGEDLWIDE